MSQTLAQALASLGSTEEEVYQTLKAHGITGLRVSDCDCPVAKYVSRLTGQTCAVGSKTACAIISQHFRVDLPTPVRDFIRWFDIGHKYQDIAIQILPWEE